MMKRNYREPFKRVCWMGGGGGNAQTDAATQMMFNEQAARLGQQLNRYNIKSPYGTSTFKGKNKQRLVEKFSPEQQAIFDQRQAADLILAQQAAKQAQEYGDFQTANAGELRALKQSELGAATARAGLRTGVLGRIPKGEFDPAQAYRDTGVDDLNIGRKSVEEALFSRLNPQFDRDRESLEARLAAQGVSSGSEAYIRDMDELRRAQTDARFGATLAGGQEQSRMASIRQQILEEELAKRRLPYDELAALEA